MIERVARPCDASYPRTFVGCYAPAITPRASTGTAARIADSPVFSSQTSSAVVYHAGSTKEMCDFQRKAIYVR